jgi:hypothetical protein
MQESAQEKALCDMINAKITGVSFTHDYFQIVTNKYILSVYNPIKYKTISNVYSDLHDFCLSHIVSRSIIEVIPKETEVCFELDNKCFITVSLADEDFRGPEAASVCFTSGEIMVIS